VKYRHVEEEPCVFSRVQSLGQTDDVTPQAVLFDFSDTLFWKDGTQRLLALAQHLGVSLPIGVASQLWADIRAASATPVEMARQRDTSREAHRACWTALYGTLARLHPELPTLLYDDQPNPVGWNAFPDTVETLRHLKTAGIPIAIVSDIGWDVRPIFVHHGVADCIGTYVLSFAHGIEKPNARMFTTACEVLGILPKQALMVGDNLAKDGGSVHSGMPAFILPAWSGVGDRGLSSVARLLGLG
jgi:FMN phosphatase YigB (HAD superfamily)